MAEKNSHKPTDAPTTDDTLHEEGHDASVEAPVEEAGEVTPTVPLDETAARATGDQATADQTPAPAESAPAPPAPALPAAKASKAGRKGQPAAAPEPPAAAAEAGAGEEPLVSNEDAIRGVFTGTGRENDLTPIADLPAPEYDPIPHASFLVVLAAVLLGALATAGVYASLSADQKKCLHLQIDGLSCTDYFKNRSLGLMDEARRLRVANAPRVGNVTIVTNPNNLPVRAPGQPDTLRIRGNDLSTPMRTRVAFRDIPADREFSFTVEGGGVWQDRTITLTDYRNPASLWIQDTFQGTYSAEFNLRPCFPGSAAFGASSCLYPVERELAPGVPAWEELRWRLTWTPPANPEEGQPTRLENAFITVTSEPSGARVLYNGRDALGPDGQPCRTPCTFSHYAPAPNAEDPTPSNVYLSREGLPVEVFLEGRPPTRASVFAMDFVCNPVPAVTPTEIPAATPGAFVARDFMGFCQYTHSTNLRILEPAAPRAAAAPAAP
jgi:hypothetical protein